MLTKCLSVQKSIFKRLVGKLTSYQNTTEQRTTEKKTIMQNSVAEKQINYIDFGLPVRRLEMQ